MAFFAMDFFNLIIYSKWRIEEWLQGRRNRGGGQFQQPKSALFSKWKVPFF